jgi:uncharacterized protein YdeI (BOF family)
MPGAFKEGLEESQMRRLSFVIVVALAAAGCKSMKSETAAAPAQKAVVTKLSGGMAGAPTPAMAARAAGPAPQSGLSLKGKVAERIDASTYTYLKVATPEGEMWTAVPETQVPVGAEVEVVNGARMDGFESKSLNRRFDKIVFGYLGGDKGGTATAAAPASRDGPMAGIGDPHAAAAAGPAAVADVKVPKAEGPDAKTVAEVWAQKTKLKDSKVSVRGTVVKATLAMNKTFLHLRDGTGSAAAKDNDLTVTSRDPAQKGDTVTIDGIVHTDVDFGAGYAYPVIIEDAKIKK